MDRRDFIKSIFTFVAGLPFVGGIHFFGNTRQGCIPGTFEGMAQKHKFNPSYCRCKWQLTPLSDEETNRLNEIINWVDEAHNQDA